MQNNENHLDFLFFNEIDLLKLRLKELNDVVNHFVLVESTRTFSNKEKPLFYDKNKGIFEKYHDKIIHLVCNKECRLIVFGGAKEDLHVKGRKYKKRSFNLN